MNDLGPFIMVVRGSLQIQGRRSCKMVFQFIPVPCYQAFMPLHHVILRSVCIYTVHIIAFAYVICTLVPASLCKCLKTSILLMILLCTFYINDWEKLNFSSVSFLSSPAPSYIIGPVLFVAGGMTAWGDLYL